mmetsp:Transcript_2490/g.8542  ORF Transcript_2490/g.8542 Transcript_2490/m.8542 type:complete len:492 (-) Transcript_2490:64-1539(-)|eukprot:CAMPEP_0182870796 /NCGR_PEP_ID=MMETSP0034_2-20130328/10743_1 /TAXON_ID=156128 /ORGANISM="Nephroselmis pyriformis, Strain CCMP717" /LENGTH=491 /DNA_ID=CAMNT_0025003313 /DNA_START=173 /DNA_END=1648 /DNA_ORIENTATION=+
MVAPTSTKRKKPATPAPKRKAARDEELSSEDGGSDDERFSASEEEEEDSEDEYERETAEEKRLRLARDYLASVKQGIDDEDEAEKDVRKDGADDTDEDESDDDKIHRDSLGQRLAQDAREGMGASQREIAGMVVAPEGEINTTLWKGHSRPVTAVCLAEDGTVAYSSSKDGAIFRWDVETGQRTKFALPPPADVKNVSAANMRKAKSRLPYTMTLSSDGRYLASAGEDSRVHIWDARTNTHLQAFPGHKDIVTALCFRQRSHQLFSGSFDRTIKIWSVDDMAYVDTLFGHNSEVLGVDCGARERLVSSGRDHTCRVWKIPDETQLIFRGGGVSLDCCSLITPTEWVTGSDDGSLSVWSQMRKKPQSTAVNAHGDRSPVGRGASAGSVGGHVASWVGSVACAPGTDLVASGAGDGTVKLWAVDENAKGLKYLAPLYSVPARGFVNSIKMDRTGRVLVAGMGQEPRLGRWGRDKAAKNGVLIHRIELDEREGS